MNPYQWLGIDPQIKNPNHFQLLGIKNLVSDENEFARQVQNSVKAKLRLLDRPELVSQAATVNKLKQRILLAGDVLASSEKRSRYVEQLKANSLAAASDSSKPSTSSGSSPVPVSSKTRDAAPKGSPPVTRGSHPEEIPFAIPMRVSQGTPTPSQLTPQTLSGKAPKPNSQLDNAHAEAGIVGETSLDSPLGGAVLKTKRSGRRRSSPFLMICASLIAIAAMAGLAFVAYLLSQPKSTVIADAENSIEHAVSNRLASDQSDTVPTIDNSKLNSALTKPETMPATAAETETKPEDGDLTVAKPNSNDRGLDPFDDLPTGLDTRPQLVPPNREDQSDPSKLSNDPSKASNDPSKASNEPSEASTDMSASAEPESSKPNVSSEPGATIPIDPAKPDNENDLETTTQAPVENGLPDDVWEAKPGSDLLTLTEAEQYVIDKQLRRIQFRQQLRDAQAAEKQTEDLLAYLEQLYFKKHPEKFTPYQRIVLALVEVNHGLSGFWDQFEASAAAVPGGQEIVIYDRPISFVEYANDQLVMRGQGFNLRYRREHIPAELAIKIAEQGAIPDIPTWRLQLAAFLASQPDGHIRNKERITEMIERSIEDGRDVSRIRDFINYRADPRPIQLNAEMPDMSAIAAVSRTVWEHAESRIGDQVNQYQLAELYDFWMGWEIFWFAYTDQSEDPELKDEKPLIHTSLALLHNAISVATKHKEAAWLAEAVAELGYLTGQNTDRLLLDHLPEIAAEKLDLRQAIELKRVAEPLIEPMMEDKKLRPVANRVKKRLQIFERQHKINGTGQTFGELK